MNSAELYRAYMRKIGDRKELFELLRNRFTNKSALYPGSHIDITPSFYYPKKVYIEYVYNSIIISSYK